MPFDAFHLKRLADELNGAIAHGKINKITQSSKDELTLFIYTKGKVVKLFFSTNATFARVCLTETEKEPLPVAKRRICRADVAKRRVCYPTPNNHPLDTRESANPAVILLESADPAVIFLESAETAAIFRESADSAAKTQFSVVLRPDWHSRENLRPDRHSRVIIAAESALSALPHGRIGTLSAAAWPYPHSREE
jgi:hypothetical protein